MECDVKERQSGSAYPQEMDWIFDPPPPSGAIQGGVPSAHVFRPDLDTFVREVVQNSLDQIKDELVTVKFVFERLEDNLKEDFLNSIGWYNLRKHIAGAAESGFATISPRLAEGLKLVENTALTILRIEDYGTVGLVGGESELGKNFGALCKNTLDTCADRPLRGGSYGLGKAVLWSFSSLSTVLFSSLVNDNSTIRFRFFGRSELPYHSTGSQQWNGPGWYGKPEGTVNQQVRAVSTWDMAAEQVAIGTHMLRQPELGTGTSILVTGFDEPGEEQVRPLKDIASYMASSVSRWFWPSLKEPDPRLAVYIEAYENGSEVYNQKVEISSEATPFISALSATQLVGSLEQQGDVATEALSFRIPARKPDAGSNGAPEQDAQLVLRVRQGGTEDSLELKNKIALVRGAGMVVQYRPVAVPLSDKRFHGVLLAGLAGGDTEADKAAEQFFRAAEPPSHKEWIGVTDRLRAEYKQGAQARLQGLWHSMESAISSMCQEAIPATSEGPERLARMFRIGGRGGGGGGPAKFRVTGVTAHLDGDIWRYAGRVTRQSEENKPWEFTVSIWLAGETGKGDPIRITHLDVDYGNVQPGPKASVVVVPKNIIRVDFSGETHAADEEQCTIFRNTRLRVEVSPRFRGR